MYCKLGEMRDKIGILRPVVTYDNEGNAIEESRELFARVWAKVLPTAANMTDAPPEDKNIVSWRIIIRHMNNLFPNDLIVYGGAILTQVAPPYLLDGRREFLVLTCREMVPDG